MKKLLCAIAIGVLLVACKKETTEPIKTATTYFVKIVEIDTDQNTVTETPIATVKITE